MCAPAVSFRAVNVSSSGDFLDLAFSPVNAVIPLVASYILRCTSLLKDDLCPPFYQATYRNFDEFNNNFSILIHASII